MDGQIWALKADSLTSPLTVTVIVAVTVNIFFNLKLFLSYVNYVITATVTQ